MMGDRWIEYKLEHLYYFSAASMRLLLERSGFEEVRVAASRKVLTIDYIARHFERFRHPVLSPFIRGLRAVIPGKIAHGHLLVPASGLRAIARKPEVGHPQ